MKSLPRSPWEVASCKKRPRYSPTTQSLVQRTDNTGIIDLTGEDGDDSSENAAAAEETKFQPINLQQKQPPPLPPSASSSPSIKSIPLREGRDEQPRSTYLRHFEDAMDFVMFSRHDYAVLFNSEERAVVRRFSRLSRGARSLYVRLFQRRGPWFRVDGMLRYDEVGSGTPLWVRNQNAAAARAIRGAASSGDTPTIDVDGGRHERMLRMLPSNPFASPDKAETSTTRTDIIDGSDASFEKSGDVERTDTASVIETVTDELDVHEAPPAKVLSAAEKLLHPPESVGAAPATLTLQELTTLHEDIQSSLHELIDTGFLIALPNDVSGKGSGLDDVLASVECCLKSDEIKKLLKRIGGLKTSARRAPSPGLGLKEDNVNDAPGPPVKRSRSISRDPAGRQAMIEELRRRLTGQQTLWGAKLPLVRDIERLVTGSLEALGVNIQSVTRCGYDPSGVEGAKVTGKRGHHFLARAADYPRVVFKRALRLMYFTTDTGALASGRVGAASVRGPQVSGAMSSWSPGLAVAFGKTRYAPYTCNPRTMIFETRDHFLRWEAAIELRCALDGALGELPRGWPELATASEVEGGEEEGEGDKEKDSPNGGPPSAIARGKGVRGIKREVILDGRQYGSENAVRAAVDGLQESVVQFLPGDPDETIMRLCQDVSTARCAALTISFLCSMCLHAHLGNSETLSAAFNGRLKSETEEVKKDDEEEVFILLGKACGRGGESECGRHSFVKSATGAVKETPSKERNDGNGDKARQKRKDLRPCLQSNAEAKSLTGKPIVDERPYPKHDLSPAESGRELGSSEEIKSHHVPEFLLQLDAGWVLASAVWEGIALLEKSRDYERAIEFLGQLLATRYTPHRRGRWWMRLSLDLAHTGRNRCALLAVREGLRDSQVRGGDRLALEKRVTMLTNRYSKSLDSKPTSRSPKYQTSRAFTASIPAHPSAVLSSVGSGRPEDEAHPSTPLSSLDKGSVTRSSGAINDEDEGEIFEDPSVEREKRRRQKRRRQKKQQKKHLQEQHPDLSRRSEETRGKSSNLELPEINGTGGSVAPTSVTDPPAPKLEFEGLSEVRRVLGLLENEDREGGTMAMPLEAFAATGGGDTASGVPEMVITGRRLNREVGMKSRFVGYDDSTACSVESLVLQHLSLEEEGSWAGWHCEGSPVRVLWTLLMWDVIFADIPDVFQTPYQDAPLDLDHCPLFYLNRREAVDARLAEIRTSPPSTLVALVADAWEANVNTVCRGVRWEGSSVRYLQALAAGLGGRALVAAFAALCLNHKHFAGGLPDLLLMRAVRMRVPASNSPPTENAAFITAGMEMSMPTRFASWLGVDLGASDANREILEASRVQAGSQLGMGGGDSTLPSIPPLTPTDIEGFRVETWLLEVKGPGDRLSDRQTAWLRILNEGGARVGVCHVTEGSGGSHVVRTTAGAKITTEKHRS